MRTPLLFSTLYLLLSLCTTAAAAQTGPLKGMVWDVPANRMQAEDDLRQMHHIGVQAIRTGLIRDERLFDLADTLGLQFFQELPLDDLPAVRLADTLRYAQRVLELALARSRNHSSARHFGLARRSDTSDPQACAFFEHLAEQVRRSPNSRVYYLSLFSQADRCADTVDFVLLDARDAPVPARLLVHWQAAHGASSGAGIGTLGVWVRAGATPGLRDPLSPETQARYLEMHLGTLLVETSPPAPSAVFVYRWRDVPSTEPSPAHDLDRPYEQRYGLLTAEDVPRPAMAVIEGFFTGQQATFAFPPGKTPPQPVPWALLIGWLVCILIAGCYAFSPRFRYLIPRYFLAHGFYREGIREGREVLLGASIVLLMALALSMGVQASVFLESMRETAAFRLLFRTLPGPVQVIGVALLAQPWMLVLLLGSFYALGVALWTALLSFASRRRFLLIPGQALMLVLWAQWPFLVLMVGAMVVPSLPAHLALPTVLGLGSSWILATLYTTTRTLNDYVVITAVPVPVVASICLANPAVLLMLVGFVVALDLGPTLTFVWHLTLR